jgi:hypothetical protein
MKTRRGLTTKKRKNRMRDCRSNGYRAGGIPSRDGRRFAHCSNHVKGSRKKVPYASFVPFRGYSPRFSEMDGLGFDRLGVIPTNSD